MEIGIGILVAIVIIALLKILEKNNKGGSAPVDNSAPGGSGPIGECREYINNTGGVIRGVNYVDCFDGVHTNMTIYPNDSFCAQRGTLHGGDSGFLVELSNC